MGQVHWEMGQVLLPEHFKMQQDHAHLLSAQISAVISNHEDGLIDFMLDQSALSCGILKVSKLSFFLPDMTFISHGFNATCKAYELDPEQTENGRLSIYLSMANNGKVNKEKLNHQDIDVECYDLFFETSFDANAAYSAKLLELKYDDTALSWELGLYTPKFIFLPKIYAKPYIEAGIEKLTYFKKILKMKCTSQSMSYRYQSLLLKSSEVDFWLQCQNMSTRTVKVDALQYNLHNLYQCVSVLFDNMTHYYQPSSNSLQNCDVLLKLIDDIFNMESTAQSEHHILNFTNGIYQSGILNDQFFVAEKRYLVIETSHPETRDEDALLKVFSPSRAHDILLRSLPGVELLSIDKHNMSDAFPNAQQVMEIMASGAEWESVVNERVLCVKGTMAVNDGCQLYIACA